MLINSVFAECKVDDRIMFSIAEVEKHAKRDVGYPYLISLNNTKDKEKLSEDFTPYFLDNRTIDCENYENCILIAKTLIENGVTNLDNGAFQINYNYWKMPLGNYFDIKKSYLKACSIIESHNTKEWTLRNIANYHSGTPSLNKKYRAKLLAKINKNI